MPIARLTKSAEAISKPQHEIASLAEFTLSEANVLARNDKKEDVRNDQDWQGVPPRRWNGILNRSSELSSETPELSSDSSDRAI